MKLTLISTSVMLIVWLFLAVAAVYLIYLIMKALRKYTKSMPVRKEKAENAVKSFEDKAKETVEKIMDTKDDTSEHDTKDIEANKGMAIISYLGPLCLVPFLVSKESKFSQYHAKQGLNLFVIEIVFAIISGFLKSIIQIPKMCSFLNEVQIECGVVTPWWLTVSLSLVELLLAIIALIGIVYACQGKAKELPLIGKFKVIK